MAEGASEKPIGRDAPPPAAGTEAGAETRRAAEARREAEDGVHSFLQESGELAHHVIAFEARDRARTDEAEAILAREKAAKTETFYSDLIYTLTNLRYDEPEARILWVNLLAHKVEMSDRLGRNAGICVAALDYFRNILGMLDDVKIMDAGKYIETAQLAVTDGLTGIFNHRYFQDRLERDLNRAREEGGAVSLMMLDIDFFKMYNDTNGHIAGDVALKEVAACLRRSLKREDLVARYGGEEFAVILYGVNKEGANPICERIRRVVQERKFPNAKVLPGGQLTISCGLASFPEDAKDRGDLIARADRALYHAKHTGRNRVCLCPSDNRRETRIRAAIPLHVETAAEAPTKVVNARSANVSAGGMCLISDTPLTIGQIMQIDLTGGDEVLHVVGQVVWQMIGPDGRSQVGVKFVNLSPEDHDRLERFVAGLKAT